MLQGVGSIRQVRGNEMQDLLGKKHSPMHVSLNSVFKIVRSFKIKHILSLPLKDCYSATPEFFCRQIPDLTQDTCSQVYSIYSLKFICRCLNALRYLFLA